MIDLFGNVDISKYELNLIIDAVSYQYTNVSRDNKDKTEALRKLVIKLVDYKERNK